MRKARLILGVATVTAVGFLALPQCCRSSSGRLTWSGCWYFRGYPPEAAADSAYVSSWPTRSATAAQKASSGNQVTVITTELYCESPRGVRVRLRVLPGPEHRSISWPSFLQADSYAIRKFRACQAQFRADCAIRLVDIGRSGIAGWMSVQGEAGQTPEEFANRGQ